MIKLFLFFGILMLTACATLERKTEYNQADLILINGNIITLEENLPTAEAIAIRGGIIEEVGTNDQIRALAGPDSKTIDLNGATVIPGFIEGHGHFLGLGEMQRVVDLTATRNFEEVVRLVAAAAKDAAPGEWIIGRGWHQEKWDQLPENNVQGYPHHQQLSVASPDHPVILDHASGHAIMSNNKAMEMAGISPATNDPAGGKIIRDASGAPIGVFEENAAVLIGQYYDKHLASLTAEEQYDNWKKSILAATEEAHKKGITSFHDAGVPFHQIEYYQRLKSEDQLQMRMYIMINDELQRLQQENWKPLIDAEDHLLTVRAIKKYMDGALGSRGAWLLTPYTDDPGNTGQNVTPIQELTTTAEIAAANGLQLAVHAIGDRANREVLDLYQKIFKASGNNNRRWRIEHAQHIDPADIPRFAELDVIASMQAIHCISDAPYVEKRLGEERAEAGAYVWGRLLEAGVTIANGTDAPVEDVDPLLNYYASVTRKSLMTDEPFYPEQALTRMEALRSLTINNAFAAFEDELKGTLRKGKLADIVVLEKDITTISPDELLNAKVLYTLLNGKIVYENKP
ncbi:amidohydrolase [soil metagenome]